jgi:hypothetical protein
MTRCRNCQTELAGTYCRNCGQKDVDLERPLGRLASEVLKETLDIDGRAYRTLRTLLLQPGVLTREYLAGKRRSYTPPLRLYLVISVAFFVLAAWLADQGVLLEQGQTREADAATQARFMSEILPRLMFVLLPAFALIIKIFEPRRLYFDHLIFSVHLHSAAYVVLALMLPMENVASAHWAPLAGQIILLGYFLVYLVIGMRRVYGAKWPVAATKSLLTLIAYTVLVSALIEATSNFRILGD